jgi:O-antigen/teichoic acid export membrane protein
MATLVGIGVSLIAQIALVPIYLTFWNKETYGIWLAIQAIIGVTTLLDFGHQTFLGYEFLKIGSTDRIKIARIFYSSIPLALMIGMIEVGIVTGIVAFGLQGSIFSLESSSHHTLIKESGIVLLIQSLTWLVVGSAGGIAVRVLSPFGYYPRIAWWGVLSAMVTSSSPAIAVVLGADLLGAGIVLSTATLLYNAPLFAYLWRLINLECIKPVRPHLPTGWANFSRSTLLTLKTLLEMVRQQGVRLLLSALTGVAGMAEFATTRTGANVALQGLGVVANPLMPELMRFLNRQDQASCEAAFGLIWLIVVYIMVPAVILLQWAVQPLFYVWTRGKIPFDPLLFAMFSLGVLVYGLSRPAVAVVEGNNLLCPLLTLSALGGGMALSGIFLFVPLMGIRGAALALLLGEVVNLIGYTWEAFRWLKKNALSWPLRAFSSASSSVCVAGIALAAIAFLPQKAGVITAVSLSIETVVFVLYWLQLPAFARHRAAGFVTLFFHKALGGRVIRCSKI